MSTLSQRASGDDKKGALFRTVGRDRKLTRIRMHRIDVLRMIYRRAKAAGRQLADAQLWDGTAIPEGAQRRLARDWSQLQALETQLHQVRAERAALPIDECTTTARYVAALQTMRAIGPIGSWVLATEVFGWREIRNGRELGAIVGLVPALSQSGEMRREQGITPTGNAHVRRVMVQLAWTWMRFQPTSALTQWFQRRFGSGGPRARRTGIVAVARKLLVALWRYVETGVVPEGAMLKSMPS